CPPFDNGTFIIDQHQLYPENADCDQKNCLLVCRALFNSSVAIFDPYANKMVDMLTFPGITHNPSVHIGGVAVDPYSGLVTILVDAAAAFATGGADISGDYLVMKWDPTSHRVLWTVNLTAITGGKYGG
ncbi:hypothetical protein QBC46DRAFT_217526, partial [Diplogelasinospora grovesii]